jgi:hypothetical protein
MSQRRSRDRYLLPRHPTEIDRFDVQQGVDQGPSALAEASYQLSRRPATRSASRTSRPRVAQLLRPPPPRLPLQLPAFLGADRVGVRAPAPPREPAATRRTAGGGSGMAQACRVRHPHERQERIARRRCHCCAARGGRGGFPPRTSTEHGCGGEVFLVASGVGCIASGRGYDHSKPGCIVKIDERTACPNWARSLAKRRPSLRVKHARPVEQHFRRSGGTRPVLPPSHNDNHQARQPIRQRQRPRPPLRAPRHRGAPGPAARRPRFDRDVRPGAADARGAEARHRRRPAGPRTDRRRRPAARLPPDGGRHRRPGRGPRAQEGRCRGLLAGRRRRTADGRPASGGGAAARARLDPLSPRRLVSRDPRRPGADGPPGGRTDEADADVPELRQRRAAAGGLAGAHHQARPAARARLRLVGGRGGDSCADPARGRRRRLGPHRACRRVLWAAGGRSAGRRLGRLRDVERAARDPPGPHALHDLLGARARVHRCRLPGAHLSGPAGPASRRTPPARTVQALSRRVPRPSRARADQPAACRRPSSGCAAGSRRSRRF